MATILSYAVDGIRCIVMGSAVEGKDLRVDI
jgi:hypothetical protein